jgi:hypothetical protein
VLQFLRWQLTPGNRGDLDYRREYQPDGVSRRFDVTYNRKVIINDSDLVPIRTQWKCGNDGEKVTREVNHDLGTLATEMKMIADKTSSTGAL